MNASIINLFIILTWLKKGKGGGRGRGRKEKGEDREGGGGEREMDEFDDDGISCLDVLFGG